MKGKALGCIILALFYGGLCMKEMQWLIWVFIGDNKAPAWVEFLAWIAIGVVQLIILGTLFAPYNQKEQSDSEKKINIESKEESLNTEQHKENTNKEKQPEKVITVEGILTNVDAMEGIQFEHYCGDLLKANGFSNIKYTEVTGDQGVDITAEKDNIKYAIQCKRYSSDIGNQAVQEVFAGKTMYGCDIGIVMTNGHFTSGAKALAKATHVALWDREILSNMIKEVLQNNNI